MRRTTDPPPVDEVDLGCHPSVIVQICFRLLDILAHLTGNSPSDTFQLDDADKLLRQLVKPAESQQSGSSQDPSIQAQPAGIPDSPLATMHKLLREVHQYTVPHDRVPERIVSHFAFSPGRPLDGIIRYATTRCGGFAKLGQTLTAYASSESSNDPKFSAANLLNHESDLYYLSENRADSWVAIDFQEMRATPEWYTLQSSHDYGPNYCHLKSWIVEGSATGGKDDWFELDMRKENVDLNDARALETYRIEKPRECRVVRIRSIGPNHQKVHYLRLAHVEFFGRLSFSEPFQGSS
jgi:hypothetical protein